ncbi:MAG: heme o synthase [Thermoplasmata archaeon]
MVEGTPAPAVAGTTTPHLADYVELTKPGITALIVAVGIGGYFLAAPTPIRILPLAELVLFGALASGGAAALNHYFDRDLDRKMRRTRERPLAEGRIAPVGHALLLGLVLSALGIGGAFLLLNALTALAIFLGGATYVGIYTLWLKRRSSWNIVVGGFAGSAPALAGAAAAVGHFTLGSLALALLLFLWTPPHFWSLALRLRGDYRLAGLPMLPDMEDPAYSGRIVVVSAALLIPASLVLWWAGPIAIWAGGLLVALAVIFTAVTAPLWREVTPARALRGFVFSGIYLLSVLAVVIVDSVLSHPEFVLGR